MCVTLTQKGKEELENLKIQLFWNNFDLPFSPPGSLWSLQIPSRVII